MALQYKVSSLNWLCVLKNGNWIPACKLTDEQIKDLLEVVDFVKKSEDKKDAV